ncbi:MAG: corrinoid protein [Anaerolineales bacterium]|nr:corrinoid protein [Anaerolineales bacterium]
MTLKSVYDAVLAGDADGAKEEVQAAINAGLSPEKILNEGLILAMSEVGQLFEAGEYFVPEMLIAARAMQAGLGLLKPHLAAEDVKSSGKVVIGTVKGDLHDIGKNLVGMMLEGAGFEVVDLGTDVDPAKFIEEAKNGAQVIGISALLTTTMNNMKQVIAAAEEAGIREDVKIVIGGAPVTDEYAQQIGADGFAPDASSAVRLVQRLVGA